VVGVRCPTEVVTLRDIRVSVGVAGGPLGLTYVAVSSPLLLVVTDYCRVGWADRVVGCHAVSQPSVGGVGQTHGRW
jgi:hypothetical protein